MPIVDRKEEFVHGLLPSPMHIIRSSARVAARWYRISTTEPQICIYRFEDRKVRCCDFAR